MCIRDSNTTEEKCEKNFAVVLDDLSQTFGEFEALTASLPSDYDMQKKKTHLKNGYRRIESPRGTITFQSQLAEASLDYELIVLIPVFVKHRVVPACNLIVDLRTK